MSGEQRRRLRASGGPSHHTSDAETRPAQQDRRGARTRQPSLRAPGRSRPRQRSAGAIHIVRTTCEQRLSAHRRSASLAGLHSQQVPPGDTRSRQSVRRIASRLKNASYGRHASCNQRTCEVQRRPRRQRCTRCPRSGMSTGLLSRCLDEPEQRGHEQDREDASTSIDRRAAAAASQAPAAMTIAAGTRLRRRLSRIFQRESRRADCVRRARSSVGTRRQQPGAELPVAADPAVAPADIGA